jgi:hypothetical protein
MGLFTRKTETDLLADTVASLPPQPANWTPEQYAQFTQQSNRAMREQNGVDPDAD